MYSAHFGLRCEPFGVTPDPAFFFMTSQHREAVASIMYCILDRRGFAALISRPGMGKTSTILYLIEAMRGQAKIALLVHPYLDSSSVIENIFSSLGLAMESSPNKTYHKFYEFLMELETRQQTCVVIVDEAQELSRDAMEALRILSNFEKINQKLLQIIFVGQSKFAGALASPTLEQLRQRIVIFGRLDPLSPSEVEQYVKHRLSVAGSTQMLFSRESLAAIAQHSQGIPRTINTLCFASMTVAFAQGKGQVALEHVQEAVRDLDVGSFTHGDERIAASQPLPSPEPELVGAVPGISTIRVSTGQILKAVIMASLAATVVISLVVATFGRL